MEWLKLIPLILSSASTIKQIIDVASSNADIVAKIQQSVPGMASLLETIGAQMFPKAEAQLHIAAGAMAAFDPNVTKWLQGSLNILLVPSPVLVVDGLYGNKTKAAVEAFETQHGMLIDGWAGTLVQTAISSLLAGQPVIK